MNHRRHHGAHGGALLLTRPSVDLLDHAGVIRGLENVNTAIALDRQRHLGAVADADRRHMNHPGRGEPLRSAGKLENGLAHWMAPDARQRAHRIAATEGGGPFSHGQGRHGALLQIMKINTASQQLGASEMAIQPVLTGTGRRGGLESCLSCRSTGGGVARAELLERAAERPIQQGGDAGSGRAEQHTRGGEGVPGQILHRGGRRIQELVEPQGRASGQIKVQLGGAIRRRDLPKTGHPAIVHVDCHQRQPDHLTEQSPGDRLKFEAGTVGVHETKNRETGKE